MDFQFSEEQDSIRELAREILEKETSPERAKEIETSEDAFDRELWAKLAEANLLGLTVSESLGGMEFGIEELCVLLEEAGRCVAPIPLLECLAFGVLAIQEAGSDEQKQRWLAPLAAGDSVLSGVSLESGESDFTARSEGDAFLLDGTLPLVAGAHVADRIVIPAQTESGLGLFLLDPKGQGVSLERRRMSTGEIRCDLTLVGAKLSREDVLCDALDDTSAESLRNHAIVATCALELGVAGRALEITADYVRERKQFGVAIGTFQAVQHRAADAYIDLEAMRWTCWRAANRLARGVPATREALVAKFWAADGGARIVASAQHLHAGIGVDLDYPVHRYFLWSKAIELTLGSAGTQLVRLGRNLARSGPQELT